MQFDIYKYVDKNIINSRVNPNFILAIAIWQFDTNSMWYVWNVELIKPHIKIDTI